MLRKLLPLAIAPLLIAAPVQAALAPGAPAPDFAAQAAEGGKVRLFSLAAALKRGPVVLYFYPAAFTPGCTLEARAFAERIGAFRRAGATVVGLSADDIDTLKRFSVEECRSKFPVAAASPKLIGDYDAKHPLAARSGRVSYVVAPDGRIVHAYSNPDYREHAEGALKAVQRWKAAQRRGR